MLEGEGSSSLVSRPSLAPVFDRFQYAKYGKQSKTGAGEGLGTRLGSSLLHPKQLSTSARSYGISTLPFATLNAMWSEAEEYLNSSNNVVQAPGDNPKSKMVTSRTGNTPHSVRVLSHSQYMFAIKTVCSGAHHICSHTLVACSGSEWVIEIVFAVVCKQWPGTKLNTASTCWSSSWTRM